MKEIVHPAVLAVTACPTGIAHTFMAAKALEQAGEKLNISMQNMYYCAPSYLQLLQEST